MSASSSGKGAGYGNNGDNSRVRSKSSLGWTAFDQKQKHGRQNSEPGVVFEDYPVLAGLSTGQILPNKKKEVLEKPFSAVVVAPMKFPSLTDTREYDNKELHRSVPVTKKIDNVEAYEKLNRLHPWADQNLIQDVLAGVNYNIQEASSLLEAMLSSDGGSKDKDVDSSLGSVAGPVSTSNDYIEDSYVEFNESCQELHRLYPWADQTLIQDVLTSVNYDQQVALSLLETLLISDRETKNELGCGTNIVPFSASYDSVKGGNVESTKVTHSGPLKNTTTKPPVEPEWYEDDVYLIHRKDAIKMMRSASRHSRAANDTFFRGDHTSAHLLSLKAREDWAAAEKLNTKAAMEILTFRNDKNDAWTLDLHGLHASEAVKALKERLQKVESPLVSSNDFALPNGDRKESSMFVSSTALDHVNMAKLGGEHLSFRRKPMLLQVITGKGNHSRGAAALPSAIRSFLSENRYRFDESRPGVIMVRPKFRQQ